MHRRAWFGVRRGFWLDFTAVAVSLHGAFIVATTLVDELITHHRNALFIDVPLVLGVSLLYLGSLLRRRKQTAWAVALIAYGLVLGSNLEDLHTPLSLAVVRSAILPVLIVALLLALRTEYRVRSDLQGFQAAVRTSLALLLTAFVYGTIGFVALNRADFGSEISIPTAAHYTVDQFDITIAHPAAPHTKRAHIFVDSLSVLSVAAVSYAALALFQPIRQRLSDQHRERTKMSELLQRYLAPSEEFFKLWPPDKQYFFNRSGTAGLAFHVYRGVALCLSDPIGPPDALPSLLREFDELCYGNDWQVALVHIGGRRRAVYEAAGFDLQQLGQEAVVNLSHFLDSVVRNKYFRNINNRFVKQGYTCERLQPPHSPETMARLKELSNQWLEQDGRVERGFVMGYFNAGYLQRCDLMVARDADGQIQAFLNQIPADFDRVEATYDLLRQAREAPSNINDFLLINFMRELQESGFKRLNMGLCPLVGLEDLPAEQRGLIDSALRFAYINGDRFYSFRGLQRFKAKYEPDWQDRYIAYRGGLRGFSRTMRSLLRAMRTTA